MCRVKLLLTGKIPAANMIPIAVPRALLLEVRPLLHCHAHRCYVGLERRRRFLLKDLSQKGRLTFVCRAYDHHLHVVVRDAAGETRFKVADDGLCGAVEEALVDGEVL